MEREELADYLCANRRAAEQLRELVWSAIRRCLPTHGIVLVEPISTFTANAKRSTAFMLYAK